MKSLRTALSHVLTALVTLVFTLLVSYVMGNKQLGRQRPGKQKWGGVVGGPGGIKHGSEAEEGIDDVSDEPHWYVVQDSSNLKEPHYFSLYSPAVKPGQDDISRFLQIGMGIQVDPLYLAITYGPVTLSETKTWIEDVTFDAPLSS